MQQYRVYCIQKLDNELKKERVVRVNVFAECIAEALNKAKELFGKKLKKNSYDIFMYESQIRNAANQTPRFFV